MLRRLTAALAAAALIVGLTGATASAGNAYGHARQHARSVAEADLTQAEDMGPGAKVTRQQLALELVRLHGMEEAARTMTAADVNLYLQNMPDAADIAPEARPFVAMLVKLGLIDPAAPFHPTDMALRLETTALFVRALGLEGEAADRMAEPLFFSDAHHIPAELTGHVAVAVDLQLVTVYADSTFRPAQGVKVAELAAMLERAEQIQEERPAPQPEEPAADETLLHGSIVLLSPGTPNLISIGYVEGGTYTLVTFEVPDGTPVLINGADATFADLQTGDEVTVTLRDGALTKIEVNR